MDGSSVLESSGITVHATAGLGKISSGISLAIVETAGKLERMTFFCYSSVTRIRICLK